MSFLTPSSTSLGWGNFLTDYLSGVQPIPADITHELARAISDAENGTSGAVGGTIYFPPLLHGALYAFSAPQVITGACALIGLGSSDVTLQFSEPPSAGGGGTTQSAFVISGSDATLRGFTLNQGNVQPSMTTGNVAAVQVIAASGVLIEDVVMVGPFFGGVDCVGSDVVCKDVEVKFIPDASGFAGELPFGFRATLPASVSGSIIYGRALRCTRTKARNTNQVTGQVDAAGYLLVPPYPEFSIDDSATKPLQYGFYLFASSVVLTGNVGTMRARNVNAESTAFPFYVDGGSVLQTAALVDDGTLNGRLLTSGFSGVMVAAGDHHDASGQSEMLIGSPASGATAEGPTSALASVVGTILTSSTDAPTMWHSAPIGAFVSSTTSGSVVFSATSIRNQSAAFKVGALSKGFASVVGSNLDQSLHGLEASGSSSGVVSIEASTLTEIRQREEK